MEGKCKLCSERTSSAFVRLIVATSSDFQLALHGYSFKLQIVQFNSIQSPLPNAFSWQIHDISVIGLCGPPLWYSPPLNLTCPKILWIWLVPKFSEFDLSQNFRTLQSGSTHNLSFFSWIILVSGGFCRFLDLLSLHCLHCIYKNYITISFCKAVQSSQLCVIPFRFSNWQERARLFTTSAQMEIWFCWDGNMILLRLKYDFAQMEIWFCSDAVCWLLILLIRKYDFPRMEI